MKAVRSILPIFLMLASPAQAQTTIRFEDSAALLGASCGKDIDANCRGVNLDPTRLKDCLTRNQDSVSPQCRTDSARAFDAIQKRVAARAKVAKACERDSAKLCGADGKTLALDCILAGPRGVSANCTRAINEAGYR
jgi:hypothetical protein